MIIEIRLADEALAKDLHDSAPSIGLEAKATREICLSVESRDIIVLLLTIPTGIAINLVSGWLKKKVDQHRCTEIEINHKRVEISSGKITSEQIEARIKERC